MTARHHFLLSLLLPGVLALALIGCLLPFQSWIDARGPAFYPLLFLAAVAGAMLGRTITRHCVPVRCPHGCGSTCWEIPGRSNRFGCSVCGRDH